MGVELCVVLCLLHVQVDSLSLEGLSSGSVRQLVFDGVRVCLDIALAWTVAEVRGLIHILPESVELEILMELRQLLSPPSVSVWREEIWVNGFVGPDLAHRKAAISKFHEHILLDAALVSVILFVGAS